MGNHVICSLYGIPFKRLDDLTAIRAAFDAAVEKMGATVLNKFAHQFTPQGVTILYTLSESHMSIHTFPEKNSAAMDIYTCGNMKSCEGAKVLLSFFQPESYTYQEIKR